MLAVGVDLIPVVLAAACVNIHVLSPQPALSVPCETASSEDQHNRKGEVRVEEALDIAQVLSDG